MEDLIDKRLTNIINSKAEMCDNLDKLFNIWKKAHINDKLYRYDTPEINGKLIKIDSFIEDGFCVTDEINEGSALYISKESNSFNEDNLETKRVYKYTHLYDCKKTTEGQYLLEEYLICKKSCQKSRKLMKRI